MFREQRNTRYVFNFLRETLITKQIFNYQFRLVLYGLSSALKKKTVFVDYLYHFIKHIFDFSQPVRKYSGPGLNLAYPEPTKKESRILWIYPIFLLHCVRNRCLGARLLPPVQECASRLCEGHLPGIFYSHPLTILTLVAGRANYYYYYYWTVDQFICISWSQMRNWHFATVAIENYAANLQNGFF